MALLLALAGLAGLVASIGLRLAGVGSMALRYPIALLLAYGAFLLLVRGWARRYARGLRPWRPDPLELVDLPSDLPSLAGRGVEKVVGSIPFGGGSFGGGGAGGAFDAPAVVASAGDGIGSVAGEGVTSAAGEGVTSVAGEGVTSAAGEGVTSAAGEGVTSAAGEGVTSAAGDAIASTDDAWPVVLVVSVLAAGLVVVALGIWMAPTLLAEAILDATIVAGTLRGLRHVEAESWTSRLVRRTWLPATALLVLLAVAGWVMQRTVPDAESIGQFFTAVRHDAGAAPIAGSAPTVEGAR